VKVTVFPLKDCPSVCTAVTVKFPSTTSASPAATGVAEIVSSKEALPLCPDLSNAVASMVSVEDLAPVTYTATNVPSGAVRPFTVAVPTKTWSSACDGLVEGGLSDGMECLRENGGLLSVVDTSAEYLITPSLGAKQDNRYQSKQIGIYKSLLFQTLLNFYCRESILSP
jgi:hypothetical protein